VTRPYNLGRRQEAADETRMRIVRASRKLLATKKGVAAFTMDAVAREAKVSRMTLYHQFGSKPAILTALFDVLAEEGGIASALPDAFQRSDPVAALDDFVAAFGRFWDSDRVLYRRMAALATIDPEVEPALRARQEWRRNGLTVLVQRLTKGRRGMTPADAAQMVDVLFTLTAFATFDVLAGAGRSPADVIPVVQNLVHRAIAGPDAPTAPKAHR
jgi:AcrR family transcriptional regulator